jgi:hypothetical protein
MEVRTGPGNSIRGRFGDRFDTSPPPPPSVHQPIDQLTRNAVRDLDRFALEVRPGCSMVIEGTDA